MDDVPTSKNRFQPPVDAVKQYLALACGLVFRAHSGNLTAAEDLKADVSEKSSGLLCRLENQVLCEQHP